MSDNKKEFTNSCIKFPCGNFEKILKSFRECGLEKAGGFNCTAIMKKFSDRADFKSKCTAIMQNLCSDKEGPIDCEALMKELFGNVKEKSPK